MQTSYLSCFSNVRKMKQRIYRNRQSIVILLSLISMVCALEDDVPLSQNQLREKFGQENTTYGDGRSCYRPCDGKKMTCYFEFNVENYDTMSGLCGACQDGIITDCFKPGCVTGNGVPRNIMSVNRRLPGTPIDVCKNDRIIVDVSNDMAGFELTIHWHGMYQKETPWSDGVPMVTQCPIYSDNMFRYVFYAREAGTHYYHAHTGLQRTNGVIGSLNVREQNDPNADQYDFDLREHSILLSDYNNFLAEEFSPGTILSATRPDSILINGHGSFLIDPVNNLYTYAPIAAFYMQKGKRHRMRIDNAASHNCPFEFCVRNHTLTVIATDGYPVQPVEVDCIVSLAGERYDAVITPDENLNETIITVRGLNFCATRKLQEFARIVFLNDFAEFAPKYEDFEPLKNRPDYDSQNDPRKITVNHPNTNCADPTTKSLCVASLEQKQIGGYTGEDLRNAEVEKQFPFRFSLLLGNDRSHMYLTVRDAAMVGMINNIASMGTPIPGLTQNDDDVPYCSAENLPADCVNQTVCHCPHLVQLDTCKVYEFFLYDAGVVGGPVSHPVHLHGYGFQVIDMGTMDQFRNGQTAYANSTKLAVVKDTVMIPSGGFVILRFRACNPGYWFFHCHFEFHMHIGMRAIIRVGNHTEMVPPPDDFPTCGHYLPDVTESCSDTV